MSDITRKYWTTAVSDATAEGVSVRGYDVLTELMGKIDFASMVYLVLKGELPTPGQAKMINALFVCFADHGISPSTTPARFMQAAGNPIQVSVATGIMMFGNIHGGAGEALSKNLQELVKKCHEENRTIDDVAEEFINTHKRWDGFGHPQHPKGDPRPPVMFALAEKYGVAGDHIAMVRAMERAIEKKKGRKLPANIDGGMAGCVCDLGFDWRLARAFVCIPRTAGLFAQCYEEMTIEKGWRQIPLSECGYDGPAPRKLTDEEAKGLLVE